jgi:5,10-methylenetetrahydrofolate reductase
MNHPYFETSTGFLVVNLPKSQASDIKIIDLITDKMKTKSLFFSIEIIPMSNLHLNYNTFKKLPLFTAITWTPEANLKKSTDSLLDAPSIKLGKTTKHSNPTLQHLTCYNITHQHIKELMLEKVRNVLALRGGGC